MRSPRVRPTEQIEQLAADLSRPGYDLAFVINQNQVFYSRYPKGVDSPSSSVIKLLQAVFEKFEDHSFRILRQRIYTTADFSWQCHGMVKVVAKKIDFSVQPRNHARDKHGRPPTLKYPDQVICVADDDTLVFQSSFGFCEIADQDQILPTTELNRNEDIESHLLRLALLNERGKILHDYDRPIAALMLDSSRRILAWAVNTGKKNKTLHAEVNLVQGYFRKFQRKPPPGTQIWVTHKPCKMCAGMIYEMAKNIPGFEVHHLNDVSGSQSRCTPLDLNANALLHLK